MMLNKYYSHGSLELQPISFLSAWWLHLPSCPKCEHALVVPHIWQHQIWMRWLQMQETLTKAIYRNGKPSSGSQTSILPHFYRAIWKYVGTVLCCPYKLSHQVKYDHSNYRSCTMYLLASLILKALNRNRGAGEWWRRVRGGLDTV